LANVFVVIGVIVCLKKISPKSNGVLSRIKKILLNVCKKIDEYEKSKYERSQKKPSLENELFFISIKNDGIYLNDIKIIDKKAELQFAIFQLLLKRHALSCIDSKRLGLKAYQIASELDKDDSKFVDINKYVRQSIAKIKANIRKKYDQKICDELILSTPNQGYYLSKKVVIIFAQK
jgi:hypothetical protein